MATYAVGDLQGCYSALRRLLDVLAFDPAKDSLWLAGDLVNRGPESLATLRFVRGLGARARCVLGNHDLHLLAVAAGGKPGRRDTLDELLQASDRDEILHWLRQQPLIQRSDDRRWLMLHAGLPPQWTVEQALACAAEAEAALRGDQHLELLRRMYGDQPDRWHPNLAGIPRLRFIINCLTRLRYCTVEGQLDAGPKGRPGSQNPDLLPWFAVPGRRSAGQNILFGHWSTLGQVHWPEHQVWGLDTGCIWGGRLTSMRLEDMSLHAVDCEALSPTGGAGDA